MKNPQPDSLEVFERVAAGEMTSAEAAALLMSRRPSGLEKPSWMPRFIYVPLAFVAAAIIIPFQGDQRA